MQELNLLLKYLGTMPELPKNDLINAGQSGEKLQRWITDMESQLKATRPVVVS